MEWLFYSIVIFLQFAVPEIDKTLVIFPYGGLYS
jgi:hypothetical protein